MKYNIVYENFKLFINNLKFDLIYPITDHNLKIRSNIQCWLVDGDKKCIFDLNQLDNTISFENISFEKDDYIEISNFIKYNFNNFKKTNINYGNVGMNYDIEYNGDLPIDIQSFVKYLTIFKRNQIIKNL